VAKRHLPSGPICFCGHPSYATTYEGDAEVWVCAETGGIPCAFLQSVASLGSTVASPEVTQLKPEDADTEYLVGAETIRRLQSLFHVSYMDSTRLRSRLAGYYDYLQVEQAWRIIPPAASVAKFEAYRDTKQGESTVVLRDTYAAAVNSLVDGENTLETMHTGANEMLLLNGTKPEVVSNILEKCLDPGMAQAGLFGRGTYFAEHPAKIDQYTKAETQQTSRETRRKLHKKLFPTSDFHPGSVRYALVCRVIMGDPDVTYHTKAGPANGHRSILAEENGTRGFREFVAFDRSAIKIEYLVCYRRVKKYCLCGSRVKERTFVDYNTGRRRDFIACDNAERNHTTRRWEGGCGLASALPRCFCRSYTDFFGAVPDVSQRGEAWKCKLGRCGFSQNAEQGSLFELPTDPEEEEVDDYDYDDDFLAPESDEESNVDSD
jgi:hypothetical protein